MPLITEAVRRMLAAGGKRLRPRLTLLAAEANGADARAHLPLAAYMELIHVGTLIHDDVVDRAETRRGVNATAVDFGNRVSVLAGDYLFAWIFKNVTADYPAPVPHILASTLADDHGRRGPATPGRREARPAGRRLYRDRHQEDGVALRGFRRMRRHHVGRVAVARAGAARLRSVLRHRVPDARRPPRSDRKRGGTRQAGRQRPARAQDDDSADLRSRGRRRRVSGGGPPVLFERPRKAKPHGRRCPGAGRSWPRRGVWRRRARRSRVTSNGRRYRSLRSGPRPLGPN